MLYAVFCYHSEAMVNAWSKEQDDAVMAKHGAHMQKLAAQGKLGPVARLMPTTTATTIKEGRDLVVLDGPFAETKEQLLGFYVIDCETLEEAIQIARGWLSHGNSLEIRPVQFFDPGSGVK